MEWKNKLDALPLLRLNLGRAGGLPADDECLEGDQGGAHYIATRTWYPTMGNVYTVSLSGTTTGREALAGELIAELGKPLIHERLGEIWFVFWKIP